MDDCILLHLNQTDYCMRIYPIVLLQPKNNTKTRHSENYQITSFVKKARRPFDPTKFHGDFIDPFFVVIDDEEDLEEDDGDDEENNMTESEYEKKMAEAEVKVVSPEDIKKLQEEGAKKMAHRSDSFGTLLRMKGFMWQASSHDFIGFISVAGNVARMDSPGSWTCLDKTAYTGTDAEKAKLRKNWVDHWGDRRQELVFIGQGLKHKEKLNSFLTLVF